MNSILHNSKNEKDANATHLLRSRQVLAREPLPLPELKINDPEHKLRGLEGLLSITYEHLNLIGYKSHGKIAAPVAV